MSTLARHQHEIQWNRRAWETKPLLRSIYNGFYGRITPLILATLPGPVVELGSGMGNLKQYWPQAISSDLFVNPWLDLVCDGYELPFSDASLSHLVLFDVFHHLEAPHAFLNEARRVLHPAGRLILFEPYISLLSHLVYGCLHPEPVGWRKPISSDTIFPRPRGYYASQGNATRLFFRKNVPPPLQGWNVFHSETLCAVSYLLSGGFSKPAMFPASWLPAFQKLDASLSRWPRLFGTRCLVGLEKCGN